MVSARVRGSAWGLALAIACVAGVYFAFFREDETLVTVTAYCSCEECCKGANSKVPGCTRSGKMAHYGTIAADPSVYPFGTRIYVPGYGEGTVEDTGNAIFGKHIDVWFPTHREAVEWGVKRLRVRTTKADSSN